jgi:hypothetical protein
MGNVAAIFGLTLIDDDSFDDFSDQVSMLTKSTHCDVDIQLIIIIVLVSEREYR